MDISIAQNVAGQIQELLQISCIFFAFFLQIGLHFSCILILAIKMELHFFCIIFAFFLHPDFWGSIFQLHLFCIFFAFISSFMFPRKRHSPTTQR